MSAPVVTFDKPLYHQGDLITATVTYTGAVVTLTVSGALVGTAQGQFEVLPNWTASDGSPRVWAFKSDNGTTAVFTATA